VHIHHAAAGLRAVVAVDNVACGPSIGGVRMAPDVSTEEAFRLARAMTWKNAAAGLAHGGGKSVLFGDPAMDVARKEQLVRAFARAIEGLVEYIPGPDMGTDERCMAWVHDEIGRAVGLPPEIGGIPLDEIGATGFGLAICAEVAQEFADVRLEGARVVVQGFGSVGRHAARFLRERGAVLVGAADSRGAIHAPDAAAGLDLDALIALKAAGRSVAECAGAKPVAQGDLVGLDCDIWIPAARPDVIRADNQARLRARLVLPGANIGVTPEAEAALHARGVCVLPDFIANAGGVICAAVEYHGGTRGQAFETIEEKIRANTAAVLGEARARSALPREAAVAMARARVERAGALRRP
jgi:glutamate dehydrogenase (NAD(P)+)